MTAERTIPHFKLSKRVYFKPQDLEVWVTKYKVKTVGEIEQEPTNYLMTRHRQITVEETMKWEKLMTRPARRSFCTNMYLMGVPVPTIMSISGHKTQKSIMMYIKVTGEEHEQIMKKFWDVKEQKIGSAKVTE